MSYRPPQYGAGGGGGYQPLSGGYQPPGQNQYQQQQYQQQQYQQQQQNRGGQGQLGDSRFNILNQNDQLNDDVQGALNTRTHLIQIYTDDPEEAPRLISESHPEGIPLMVLMRSQPCCCYCKVNVPNGIYTLQATWGKYDGIMEPGCKCCFFNYKEIKVMITKNTIRFKCPVQNVPTKDDVRVSLDVGINFHIGSPDSAEEDCKRFFYNFGPNRLEELLQEESDEGIRDFIKKIKVSRVRDIKTELTSQMMEDLRTKFGPYGVHIEQVNIMNVLIPKDLRVCLMETTNYDVQLQKQVKYQENKLLITNNSENKMVLKLKRDNMQVLFKLQHDKDVEEINLQTSEVEMETEQIVKKTLALKEQSCKTIDAENIKFLAEARAKAKATTITKQAEAYFEQQKINADNEASIIRENAQARLEVAQGKSEALIKEANAEESHASSMDQLRKFAEKLKLQEALKKLAQNGHMVISGKNGQDILNFYNKTIEEVTHRQ